MDKRMENVRAAMADKEFVEKIVKMEEPEDVQAAFAEKGVEFTLEEISAMAEKIMQGNFEEMTEEQLDDVTGGVDPVTCVCAVIGVLTLAANVMTEVNNNRKAQGKKTIW